MGTFEAAGLPRSVVSDFLVEEGFGPLSQIEVSAEESLAEGIAWLRCVWTCICTPCCLSGSCWITI